VKNRLLPGVNISEKQVITKVHENATTGLVTSMNTYDYDNKGLLIFDIWQTGNPGSGFVNSSKKIYMYNQDSRLYTETHSLPAATDAWTDDWTLTYHYDQ